MTAITLTTNLDNSVRFLSLVGHGTFYKFFKWFSHLHYELKALCMHEAILQCKASSYNIIVIYAFCKLNLKKCVRIILLLPFLINPFCKVAKLGNHTST